MSNITELYGLSTQIGNVDWASVVVAQHCPYLGRTCLKTRKSAPEVTIGVCSVEYGREQRRIIICPFRLLERQQIFVDCIHLLTVHEPGNELYIIPEVTIPGGSVDYVLVSARKGKVKDLVGIEIQTLDTTGTIWPIRQRFLHSAGVTASVSEDKGFGMNWKMTAKTTLVQLYHKLQTFENINKRLVLVIQDHLLAYMRQVFRFDSLREARIGDSWHTHAYELGQLDDASLSLDLRHRYSTDVAGLGESLGLRSDPNVEWEQLVALLETKMSDETRLDFPRWTFDRG